MELQEKKRGSGIWSFLAFVLLVVVVMGIALLVYLKNQNVDIRSLNVGELISEVFYKDKGKEAERIIADIKYDSKERPVFKVYRDYIIKCTTDRIICLSKEGKEQWTRSVSAANPIIRTAGQYLLVADLGGRNIYMLNGSDIKWSERTDGNIINADINEKGYVSVVRDMKGYKSAVQIFDPHGNWIFIRPSSENFILSARVLPRGNGVVINEIDSSAVAANSNIVFADMKGNQLAAIKYDNLIFPNVWCFNDGSALAVSDSGIFFSDGENNKKWTLEYERVYSSNVISGKSAVVAVREAGGSSVKILDSEGQMTAEYKLESDAVNLETFGSIISVNTGREVLFINTKGELAGKYKSASDIRYVCFFNKQEAAVITKDGVIVTEIN
ncbi:hypothetical protein DFR58_101133 [Anaerobacterium chartisolvens]|uniref:Pyrroloquinoline-quinone binding quinoprotein n=1 Tax=Anaerobacterium chartisolvens TaxID=1297424 RepID=A0A369BHP4_9FIRM|nr:DUF5711 family protein [Anaerobacterium chartisolvens]RCX20931.1 hypothetical protein DFR58_101133 [Anaerobacterium chartisolvens]